MTAAAAGSVALPTLGVLVPCRNEGAVLARKLANLGRIEWPPALRPHRVVVVDDGSSDDTAALARELLRVAPWGAAVEGCVVENQVRPGKSGAIEAGLRRLAGAVDVIVLTDADVVFEAAALVRVARAFQGDARLGMASGAQRFVRDLREDGAPLGADGEAPRPAAGLYDRITARVRALESARGRLFSVHGQLLCWRAELGLSPTPGFAADDLDLMAQVRLAGRDVRLLEAARFLEVKTPAGAAREEQATRRARAYVQFLRNPHLAALAASARGLDRLQVWAYRRLPVHAPWWLPAGLLALLLVTAWSLPRGLALGLWLALGLAAVSAPGRKLFGLLSAIRGATRQERLAPLSDRWETPRA